MSEDVECKTHPDAPHGFVRNASLTEDRLVCECEYWEEPIVSEYTPDRWMIVKITNKNVSHYRVFACWYGGFAGTDSWQMNSGIVSVTLDEDGYYHFKGSSGSIYHCHRKTYGISGYGASVLARMSKSTTIEQLPEEINPLELNYTGEH